MTLAGMLKWRREDKLMSSLLKTFPMEKKEPKMSKRTGMSNSRDKTSENRTSKSNKRDSSKVESKHIAVNILPQKRLSIAIN
jgi:hypothetical protein